MTQTPDSHNPYATPESDTQPISPATSPGTSLGASTAPTKQEPLKLATTSKIMSVVAWIAGGPLLSLPAVIMAHMALKKMQAEPDRYNNRNDAMIGLYAGYANLGLLIFVIVLSLATA